MARMLQEVEPEILDGRRVWSKSQELFEGIANGDVKRTNVDVGWYGTEVHDELGAFCVVHEDRGLLGLVGEFVRVEVEGNVVFLYCVGSTTSIATPLATTRVAWQRLGALWYVSRSGFVESVQ